LSSEKENGNVTKDNILQDIIKIAQEAGDRIMEVYEKFDPKDVEYKDDRSPLTMADKAANDHIVTKLKKLTPRIPIIAEESEIPDFDDRMEYTYFWLVDPLDGTKEFVKKNGEFTVNIALCRGQEPILGIVHAPALKKTYSGMLESGAFLYENGKKTKLQCAPFDPKAKGLRFVVSRSHLNDATKAYLTKFDEPETVATGSSLKFMLLCEGKADCYPRLGPTMEWDTAASHIILEEAGGKIAQVDGHPLVYNKEELLNPHFIASGA
jgi:3'(2'), 5'-bisphosphate nucleotidase